MATSLREALGYSSELAEFFRHLSGQHDQKTHGRGGGGAIPAGFDTAPARLEIQEQVSGPIEQFGYEFSQVENVLAEHGMTPDDIPAINQKWNDAVEGGEVRVDIDEFYLESIVSDGRLKSQFEVGRSGGTFNERLRSDFEHRHFGLDDDVNLPASSRPIYGYVGTKGSGASTQYGNTTLVLKDSVKDRSTYYMGDSLATDMGFGGTKPVAWKRGEFDAVENVDWQYLRGGAGVKQDLLDAPSVGRSVGRHGYVESQVWGGVSVSDISEVRFSSRPSSAHQALLDDAGVPWSVSS